MRVHGLSFDGMYRGGLLEADHYTSFVRARAVVQWFTDAVGAVETKSRIVT